LNLILKKKYTILRSRPYPSVAYADWSLTRWKHRPPELRLVWFWN